MSRPLRIEYAGAWYHVMNRGAARQVIYLQPAHRQLFLALLGELLERFGIETHAYCLMDNHYHLLLHTPKGQLSRGMRHLNGLYTQRFNRREQRDGALFRGRYKAILVEADSYLLHVSRYIHRNPLEAGFTEPLERYRWSSYAAYVGYVCPEPWLQRHHVLAMAGGSPEQYAAFVKQASDRDVDAFYDRQRLKPILGGETFMVQVTQDLDTRHMELADARRLPVPPTVAQIVDAVAASYHVKSQVLTDGGRPQGELTTARNVAMWLCQVHGGLTLSEMAEAFRLGHYTSVSTAIGQVKRRVQSDARLRERLTDIQQCLDVYKSNT
jgi:REP element-mobilizing transposase RayT